MAKFLLSHSPAPLPPRPLFPNLAPTLLFAIMTSTCPPHVHRDVIDRILSSRSHSPSSPLSTLTILSPCPSPPSFSSPLYRYTALPSSHLEAAAIINSLSFHVFISPYPLPPHTHTRASTSIQVLLDLDAYTSASSIKTVNAVVDALTSDIALQRPSPVIVSAIAWAAPAAQ